MFETNVLLLIGLVLLAIVLVLLVVLLTRRTHADLEPLEKSFESVERALERTERSLRDEITANRTESQTSATTARTELAGMLQKVDGAIAQKLAQSQAASLASDKSLREELVKNLNGFNEAIVASIGEMGKLQKDHLDLFQNRLQDLTKSLDDRLDAMRKTVEERITGLQEENGKKLDAVRVETTTAIDKVREAVTDSLKTFNESMSKGSKELREEVGTSLKTSNESMLKGMTGMSELQKGQLETFSVNLTKLTETTEKKLDLVKTTIDERLKLIQTESTAKTDQMREELSKGSKQLRDEVNESQKAFNDSVLKGMTGMSELQNKEMEAFTEKLGKLTESQEKKLDAVRTTVEEKLKSITEDNSKQLEQIRLTVDEKLQGTLEKRLGESFKQVSERLEAVHKGLGEMQSLAVGVGDLKKVLSNVKTRGTWGEVQLGTLLEQVLHPDQYVQNFAPKDSGERVEFAIKLPGRSEDKDEVVWLPIDAKFPIEDYLRLTEAQENVDLEAIDAAAKQLENRVKACAQDISRKYLDPPNTTDFGILFLPTEGLFAEVARRTGLAEFIQREHRVVIAGPTTLWSILNSLQMGFRTLAIEKRSSEVWNLLGAVKTEWSKYGEVLDKVKKKLNEASNTIDAAATRTRAIGRKLKTVEVLSPDDSANVLKLETDVSLDEPDAELSEVE